MQSLIYQSRSLALFYYIRRPTGTSSNSPWGIFSLNSHSLTLPPPVFKVCGMFATKFELEQGKAKFIQTRNSGTRDGFPWINQEIHHLMRKRDKLYKRWPRSRRPYDQSKFLNYKQLVRRVSGKAFFKNT